MKRDLRFEAVYLSPPERVWRALTNRDELAQWLMDNDFQAYPGQKFRFHDKPRPGFNGTVYCEVIEIEAPRHIAYSWVCGDLHSIVRFSLEAVPGGGTRLILEHTGFDNAGGMMISALLAWNRRLREMLPKQFGETSKTTIECNMDIVAALIERYERGAKAFARLISDIPTETVGLAAANGEWSAHETALHIVDAEIVGAMRLRMIAAQPGSKLTSYAGDVWGRELAYARLPLAPGIELFEALRQNTVAMLRLLPASAWLHRAEHEEAGEVTLQAYLDSHCEHAELHMQEIEQMVKRLSAAPVSSGQ
jgi:uncharacterized protein YndB with AHSA1/START domain